MVAGDSAGGGLVASLVLVARAEGLPLPAGVVCSSPWADLTVSAASYETNADTDRLFSHESATTAAATYLDGHDPSDPLVSPVFGDWTGGPPMLVQVGDVEVLLDDALRLAARAHDAGVDVTLHVEPEMPHIWPMSYPAFPEAVAAVDEIAAFVHRVTRITTGLIAPSARGDRGAAPRLPGDHRGAVADRLGDVHDLGGRAAGGETRGGERGDDLAVDVEDRGGDDADVVGAIALEAVDGIGPGGQRGEELGEIGAQVVAPGHVGQIGGGGAQGALEFGRGGDGVAPLAGELEAGPVACVACG